VGNNIGKWNSRMGTIDFSITHKDLIDFVEDVKFVKFPEKVRYFSITTKEAKIKSKNNMDDMIADGDSYND